MNRKLTDLVLYMSFCILCGTGIMLWMAPKGIDWQALALHEDWWKAIHISFGFIMFSAMLLHLAINKKWLDKVGTSGRRWLFAALVVLGAALIAIPAAAPVSLL